MCLQLLPKIIRVRPGPQQCAALHQVAQAVGEYRAEKIVLGAEVVLDRRIVRRARLDRDLAQRDTGESVLGEQPFSCEKQLQRRRRRRSGRGVHHEIIAHLASPDR